ncbi:Arginine/ornithine antiporter ArcD [Candidatus Rhodobacter oscarellae]|uniref:Arginine/ornithine antiporter ArcD n=1 Tax=Candidatus Rhodobacter oscarellae TaxID=1675527 RepID=A0A0J9GWC6_9RHOB|nr:DMT family transporter [Candidatus Rhodobacter lobularis]KMW57853.1 Arginine/ornithine antiporter ArcD [Candidatus Rhodobacter lobularis]
MPPPQPNIPGAIAFMLLATVFIGGTMILAKALQSDVLGPALPAFQVSHARFLFAFLAISMVAAVMRPRFERPRLRLHLMRASFGWVGVTCMFASVAFIPVSDATALTFLNPVFAMALAIPFLGERVGPYRWLAAGIALVGALILLRPGPGTFQPAALLALGSAMFFGAEIICVKLLSSREGAFQILLVNNAIGLTLASIAVSFVWQSPTAAQWAAMAGIGIVMATAQAMYVNAMSRAEASLIVPFSYGTLVFATLYDALFFDVLPDAVSWTGAGVIIAGALLLAWREARAARPAALRPVATKGTSGLD